MGRRTSRLGEARRGEKVCCVVLLGWQWTRLFQCFGASGLTPDSRDTADG